MRIHEDTMIRGYDDMRIFMMILLYEVMDLRWKGDKSDETHILKILLYVKVAMLVGEKVPNKELVFL